MIQKFIGNFVAKYQKWILLTLFVVMLAFPFIFPSRYVIRIAIVCMLFIVLTQSINLLGGMLGQLSLGHIAFYGIGAYTCTILTMRFQLPSIVTWLAATLMAGIFGLLLSLPTLRLRGYYLAIVTMGFGEILRIVELNWYSLTNGALGISGIPKPDFFGYKIDSARKFYFLIFLILLIVTVFINRFMDSRHGRAIVAIREDDIAAQSMGINIFKYKATVFVISAMIAGLCGAFYAQYTAYIDPTVFTSGQSTLLIIMGLLGGLGSQVGPFIGATILTILPEAMRFLMDYRMLLYGVVMLAVMLFKSDGLVGNFNFQYIRQRYLYNKSLKATEKPVKEEQDTNA